MVKNPQKILNFSISSFRTKFMVFLVFANFTRQGMLKINFVNFLLVKIQNMYLYSESAMKNQQNDIKIYHILRYKKIFFCKNHLNPSKNIHFHAKPIQFSNLFAIFRSIYFFESPDVALQTYKEIFSKTCFKSI